MFIIIATIDSLEDFKLIEFHILKKKEMEGNQGE